MIILEVQNFKELQIIIVGVLLSSRTTRTCLNLVVKGGAMKDHRGGDKLYHLAHC